MTTLQDKISNKKLINTSVFLNNLPIKSQPFIYLLDDRIDESNDIKNRYLTITRKLISIFKNKFDNMSDDDKRYYNTFIHGLLPEYLFPAAYIPFNRQNTKENFNRLTFSDKLLDNYYFNLFLDPSFEPSSFIVTALTFKGVYDDTRTSQQKTLSAEEQKAKDEADRNSAKEDKKTRKEKVDTIKTNLQSSLKDRLDALNSSSKVYNIFCIRKLIIFCVIFWFIIILFLLKTIHYYFYTSYNYIILTLTIMILLSAVLWKMIYTLY